MPTISLQDSSLDVEACGFDVDGVLRDSGYHAYVNTCRVISELGGTPPQDLASFVRGVRSDYDAFFRECGLDGESAFMAAYQPCLEEHFGMPPFADVLPTFRHMRELDIKVFIVSGSGRVDEWLSRSGLDRYISHIAGLSRDKTSCLLNACSSLDVAPSRTAFVGDWGLDMREGAQAGVVPIGITRGLATRDALLDCGARYVIEHLDELTA